MRSRQFEVKLIHKTFNNWSYNFKKLNIQSVEDSHQMLTYKNDALKFLTNCLLEKSTSVNKTFHFNKIYDLLRLLAELQNKKTLQIMPSFTKEIHPSHHNMQHT